MNETANIIREKLNLRNATTRLILEKIIAVVEFCEIDKCKSTKDIVNSLVYKRLLLSLTKDIGNLENVYDKIRKSYKESVNQRKKFEDVTAVKVHLRMAFSRDKLPEEYYIPYENFITKWCECLYILDIEYLKDISDVLDFKICKETILDLDREA